VTFWPAADGWTILQTPREYETLKGLRLTAIGTTPISRARELLARIASHDNDYSREEQMVSQARSPIVLLGLGIISQADSIPLTVTDGEREWQVMVQPLNRSAIRFAEPTGEAIGTLWLQGNGERYWSKLVTSPSGRRVLYVQFSSSTAFATGEGRDFAAFERELLHMAIEGKPDRILLDLRLNGGGNYPSTASLLATLIQTSLVTDPGRFFVIIGGRTFSSAIFHATALEKFTAPIFVGTPTGGRPGWVGETGAPFRLPHSGLAIALARAIHDPGGAYDDRPAILPDLIVPFTSADIRAGRDPAMQAAFDYNGSTVAQYLYSKLDRNDTSIVARAFDGLTQAQRADMQISAAELTALTERLVSERRIEEAVAAAHLLLRECPWSVGARRLLADVLVQAGDTVQARQIYVRVYQENKQFSDIPDILRSFGQRGW
jgi:hypothetical protein